jgi:type I restriction enzyme, S subunit
MSPFDKARYERLLKGLEVSETPFRLAEEQERFDAASLSKSSRQLVERLERLHSVPLESLADVSDGNHLGIASEFSESVGVRYLRGQDISGEMVLEDRSAVFIPDIEYEKLSRSHIFENDVLVTIVGANTGYTALVFGSQERLTANCKLGILRARKNCVVHPAYLHIFLAGRYGQLQIDGKIRGGGQTGLILPDLKALRVPRFGQVLEEKIAQLSTVAHRSRLGGRQLVDVAERSLLCALGLDKRQMPPLLSYVRSSRDAQSARRLDAEYFAPHVAGLLALLGRDGLAIADVAPARHDRFAPAATGSFRYIEIGGLDSDGTAQSEETPHRDAPSRATQHVCAGDVITSTVRPIRRLSAVIGADQDGCVCSSGFVVLQPQTVSSEVLLTYLRLRSVCELMDLHTSATMYPAISEADLLALPIPNIPDTTQRAIEKSVRAARQAKARATQLLDAAKRAVEIAIEDSEAAALQYLGAFDER